MWCGSLHAVPDDDHTDKWVNPKRGTAKFNVVMFILLSLFLATGIAYMVLSRSF